MFLRIEVWSGREWRERDCEANLGGEHRSRRYVARQPRFAAHGKRTFDPVDIGFAARTPEVNVERVVSDRGALLFSAQ